MKDWQKCERQRMQTDKARGCKIVKTGLGSDYLRLCKGEKPTFVEVKSGSGRKTTLQKATERFAGTIGFGYVEERCAPKPKSYCLRSEYQ